MFFGSPSEVLNQVTKKAAGSGWRIGLCMYFWFPLSTYMSLELNQAVYLSIRELTLCVPFSNKLVSCFITAEISAIDCGPLCLPPTISEVQAQFTDCNNSTYFSVDTGHHFLLKMKGFLAISNVTVTLHHINIPCDVDTTIINKVKYQSYSVKN